MFSMSKNLLNNNRFYVLVFSFLLSIFVTCWLRLRVMDDQLYYIQLAQSFGFLSIACLYMTLIISPVQKIIGKPDWMENVIFARRAIGVSAAYFALLHAGIALQAELGGFGGLALLPDRFVWPLILGIAALVVFCILACISLDKMVVFLGYRRWKWIQRSVYVCGILIIIHVWAIGVHLGPGVIRNVCLAALVVLFGLESWRAVSFLAERWHWRKTIKPLLFLALWFLTVLLLGWISFSRSAEAHMLLKDTASKTGTILHVTPDDDPIAGEQSSLIFDIQDAPPGTGTVTAELIIIDEQDRSTNVPAHAQENTVKAAYTFPRQGLYTLILSMRQDGKETNRFMESQRVSRGMINNATAHGAPLWAGTGLLCTVIAAIAVAAVAISRRSSIKTFSKL